MIYRNVLSDIESGIKGRNVGLPNGFNRINRYLSNIQKGIYYVIGGEPGTGKSAIVDHMFLHSPFDYLTSTKRESNIDILYFSLELSKEIKIAKAIARKLFFENQILTDTNKILSRGSNRLSVPTLNLIKNYEPYFRKLEDSVLFFDGSYTPSQVEEILQNYYNKYYNKDKYVIIIIDHIGLIKTESGKSKKQAIDDVSKTLVMFRNKYKCTPVVVQQLNRTISSADRFKINRVEPQLSDFKDSGNTQEDANIVLSVFSPQR